MDTLAFGYILPTTGRIRDFHPLETCAARRTRKRELTLHEMSVPFYIVFQNCFPDFLQIFDLRIQRYSQLSGISEIDIYLFIAEHVGRYQPRLIELVIDEHL